MLIVAGLRHQDAVGTGTSFDEVVTTNICHDLCTRQNLCVKLLLELSNSLLMTL